MSHPLMALQIEECVELTHMKDKITIITATRNSPMKVFMLSILAIVLRTRVNDVLEHFCVCINGPDSRTGDPSLQDKKQQFLEELRDIPWYNADNPVVKRPMPITVIRAWSRVGYGEPFEMAIPWVHTDSYLLMHDDVIIKEKWTEQLKAKFFNEDNVALAFVPPLLACGCDHHIHRGMYLLRLPQMEITFVACKKKWLMKAGVNWSAYHIPSDDNMLQFDISEIGGVDGDAEGFLNYYKEKGLIDKPILTTELYNFVRQEIGAWVYYKLSQAGHKMNELDSDTILHLEQMSRGEYSEAEKMAMIEKHSEEIKILEAEVNAHPDYSKIYNKYL